MYEETRLNHKEHPEYGFACSDEKQRLYVKNTEKGLVWHCHNCGTSGFKGIGERTPKQTLDYFNMLHQEVTKDAITNTVKKISLPKDFTLDIPTKALLWVYKYGITDSEIKLFRFGWSETLQRLILPVYQDEQLIYYQGRTFDPITKTNSKYLNIRQAGAKNVFFRRNTLHNSHDSISMDIHRLVIVEDILSCIKVGRYVDSLALLGSYVPKTLYNILESYLSVYLWLDQDKIKESIKYSKSINSVVGIPARVVSTVLDPKECNDQTIKSKVN